MLRSTFATLALLTVTASAIAAPPASGPLTVPPPKPPTIPAAVPVAPAPSPPGISPSPTPASNISPGELHDQIIAAYMKSDFTTVDTLFHDRVREIALLPKDLATDVNAVRYALLECRPMWWAGVKIGKKTIMHPALWGRTFAATYDPDCKSSLQLSVTNGAAALTVNWPAAEMDSDQPGEHGFTKGELTDLAVFATLGSIDSWSMLPPAESALTDSEKLALGRYIDFRGNLAGIGYTTPGGRRWGVWLFLAAYQDKFAKMQMRMGREALGAFVIGELLTHPEVYKSFELPKTLPAENAEALLGKSLSDFVEKHHWTFAEDVALRAAVKGFSNANGPKTYTTGLVVLPNKLNMSLDPEADKPLQAKRDAWVKEQYDKAQKAQAVKN